MRILLYLLLAVSATAQDFDPQAVTGNWDLAEKTRKYAVLGITREDGHRYPGFWAGELNGGQFSIGSQRGILDDDRAITSKGGFSLRLTTAAAKHGMAKQIPGGPWMATLKEQPIEIAFTGFSDWAPMVPEKKSKITTLRGSTRGTLKWGGKTAPFTGTLSLSFPKGLPKFDFSAEITFQAAAAGLPGKAIRLTLMSASPNSKKSADLPEVEFKLE